MMQRSEFHCDCFRTAPWPTMILLHGGRELNRYYLCPRCGTIREDALGPDGTIVVAHFHHAESTILPGVVVKRARDILAKPSYRQLSLFGDD